MGEGQLGWWCDVVGNPWVDSHGTHTHQCGYGFYAGTGTGGPKFTHGLPVTNPTAISCASDELPLDFHCTTCHQPQMDVLPLDSHSSANLASTPLLLPLLFCDPVNIGIIKGFKNPRGYG